MTTLPELTDKESCLDSLRSLPPAILAEMSLSTRKSLPRDAGKFVTCNGISGAHHLLATMMGAMPMAPQTALKLGLGLCVPEACGQNDVPAILNSSALIPDLRVLTISNVHVSDPVKGLAAPGIRFGFAVAIVMILVLMIAVSTAYAWVTNRSQDSPNSRLARNSTLTQAFSLIGRSGTLTKLVELPPSKPTDCLNGLRVLAMAWIILGHSFLMPEGVSGYLNPQDITSSPLNTASAESNPLLMIIIQAEQSVDTFFFLSGFLLSHLMLKELQHRGAHPLLAILLRYFRLTPSLALAMLVYYGILPYLAFGPFAATLQDSIFRRCDGSWWSELTYTMNFIPFDSDKVCMGWTWYLGDDMIFFLLGSAVVPIYHRRKKLGWLLLVCLIGLSMGATAWLIARYHLSPYVFDSHYTQYSYYAYSKPYTRAPAYFVGISTAWFLQMLENKGVTRETQPCERRQLLATSAAVAAVAILCLVVFIPATDFGKRKNSWNDFESILLLDVGRVAWALAWAVITVLCYYGYLPLTNAFLSHPGWTPFVRLTYGAYLLHPLVIKLAAGTSVQYYTFSGMEVCYRFIGNCLMAYASAIALWCLIERPIMTLTTAGLKPRAIQQKIESSNSGPALESAAGTGESSEPSRGVLPSSP